jgi:hypothetical protein
MMSSKNHFNSAAIKVFSEFYECIKADEMLQEYESHIPKLAVLKTQ